MWGGGDPNSSLFTDGSPANCKVFSIFSADSNTHLMWELQLCKVGVAQDSNLLRWYALSLGERLLMFQTITLSSSFKDFSKYTEPVTQQHSATSKKHLYPQAQLYYRQAVIQELCSVQCFNWNFLGADNSMF
jgi:hypothetical protein